MTYRILTIALVAYSMLACSGEADAKSPQKALKRIKARICKEHPTSKDWSSKKQCIKSLGEASVRYLGTDDGSDTSCLEKAAACYPTPKASFDACREKAIEGFDFKAFGACMKNPTASAKLCYQSGLFAVKSCARKSVKELRAQTTLSQCVRRPDSAPKYCPASSAQTASAPVAKPKKRRKGQKCAADKIERMLVGKGYFKTYNFNASTKNKLEATCVGGAGTACDRNRVELHANGQAVLEWHQTSCINCPMRRMGMMMTGGPQYASGCALGSWVNTCDAIEVQPCPEGVKKCNRLRVRLTLEKGAVVARQVGHKNAGGRLYPAKKSEEKCSLSRRYCGFR